MRDLVLAAISLHRTVLQNDGNFSRLLRIIFFTNTPLKLNIVGRSFYFRYHYHEPYKTEEKTTREISVTLSCGFRRKIAIKSTKAISILYCNLGVKKHNLNSAASVRFFFRVHPVDRDCEK